MAAEWRLVYLGLDRPEKMSQRMCLSWGFMEELGITRKMKKKSFPETEKHVGHSDSTGLSDMRERKVC